jgi:hypothetical protein
MKAELLYSFALITSVTLSLFVFSASAITIPTFTVTSISRLPIMLPKDTTFTGSISTSGILRFWINGPDGTQVVNLGLIEKSATFNFVAQQNGNYTLNFENDQLGSKPPQVDFSFETNPDLPNSYNSTEPSFIYLSIPIIVTVLGSILIIVFVRRQNKKLG